MKMPPPPVRLGATAAQAETVHITYDDLIADRRCSPAHRSRRAQVCGHDRAGTRNLRMDQMTRNCFNQAKAEWASSSPRA